MKHKSLIIFCITFLSLVSCAAKEKTPQNNPVTTPIKQQIESTKKGQETGIQQRSLAVIEQVAAEDLQELNEWWQTRDIKEPHKYLLPVILARLSLEKKYNPEEIWPILRQLEEGQPDLYHFRSPYDIRIFFLFRDTMPEAIKAAYQSMLSPPRIKEWNEQGTENHMFMQRISGLALMDGSGWTNQHPAVAVTNEAWLRAELNKFLTIGQGEFHSSTYYGYSIGGLLNLYDFAKTPELKQLAKATLDWYATNTALRLSWGTAGGAESRGFDRGTWDESELSALAWVWWGNEVEVAQSMKDKYARVALFAALSDYRPPLQLSKLARKEVPLPFSLTASHPSYYSYHEDNFFQETFYLTQDYSLGTLLNPQRSYGKEGTINAQYATYKLVIRDPDGIDNAVVSLGGTYFSPLAKGSSPGDQYLQEKGSTIYQLWLNPQDKAAGVPNRSQLVLPLRYGKAQRYGDWYIWKIENTWLCARPWGETVFSLTNLGEKYQDYQALVAEGNQTAWITEVARVADYRDISDLKKALDKTKIEDSTWDDLGKLTYTSLQSDRLSLIYNQEGGIGKGKINGKERVLENLPVLDSPYVQEQLKSGILSLTIPGYPKWQLQQTINGPEWDVANEKMK